MFDKKLVTWKVCATLPVAFLGEAMYQICDTMIYRILEPLADALYRWCLKAEYKRG